jgi:hypothetical protein
MYIDPLVVNVILVIGAGAVGFLFAKYPELPSMMKKQVREMKEKLDMARAEGIPVELNALYAAAYDEVDAWDKALADDKLTWSELRDIGMKALALGELVMEKIAQIRK